MFRKRIERAFNYTHEKRAEREASLPPDENDTANAVEKGDIFAMIVSAFGVIMPVAIAVLLVMALLGYLFIFR